MAPPEQPSTSDKEAKGSKEECAWCRYMKGGGCREPFEAWQACVDNIMGEGLDDEARRAAVDKCSSVTQPLFECMMRHRNYYGSQLAGMGGGADATSTSGSSSSSGTASARDANAATGSSGGSSSGSGSNSSSGRGSSISESSKPLQARLRPHEQRRQR